MLLHSSGTQPEIPILEGRSLYVHKRSHGYVSLQLQLPHLANGPTGNRPK
jgi:hypothetical protein